MNIARLFTTALLAAVLLAPVAVLAAPVAPAGVQAQADDVQQVSTKKKHHVKRHAKKHHVKKHAKTSAKSAVPTEAPADAVGAEAVPAPEAGAPVGQ